MLDEYQLPCISFFVLFVILRGNWEWKEFVNNRENQYKIGSMNWLSFHIASGASLFSGAALLIMGVFATGIVKNRAKFLSKLAATVGVALILLSSTPFPFWLYLSFILIFLGWITLESIPPLQSISGVFILRILVISSSLTLGLFEMPHQKLASLPEVKLEQIYIVGDSISAGIDESPRWSDIFQKRYGRKIINLAKPAATLSSALKQSSLIPGGAGLVVLEIGGNDLFNNPTPAEFEKDLKQLLDSLHDSSRTIVMFELPLLPAQAQLGRVQRSVAKEHGVYLVPKRYFCQILSAPHATIDGLHLSPIGISLMADLVYRVIGSLLK